MLKERMKVMIPAAAMTLGTALPVLASDTSSGTANSAVVSAMTSAAADMTATGTALVPIALGVITLLLVVRYGIKFFKSIAR